MAATLRFYLPWAFQDNPENKARLGPMLNDKDNRRWYFLDGKTRLYVDDDGRLFFSYNMGDFVPPNIEAGEITLRHSSSEFSILKSGPYKDAQLGVFGEVERSMIKLRGPSEENITVFYWAIRGDRVAPISAEQMFIETKRGLALEGETQKTVQNKLQVFWKILLVGVNRLADPPRRAISLLRELWSSK
ncbi:MAG: hypothetical protein ABH813_00105 [Patescibacteria group bacterium]